MVKTKNNDKMINKKVYIAGPISGHDLKSRKEAFKNAEIELKRLGHNVVNPIELPHNHDKSWESYMKECIEALLKCDTICLLHGWNKSKGAKLEFDIANAMEYKIIIEK